MHGLPGRRLPMFSNDDLKCLDPEYFIIIVADAYDVTIMSRNTGHYWYIHSTDRSGDCSCVIFHKHKFSHPYHHHGSSNGLKQAIQSIRSHDRWQICGRKPR